MTAAFPSALALPNLQSYGVAAGSGLDSTAMSAGNVRLRRRFANVPQSITASWVLSCGDRATLAAFVESAGPDEFWMPLRVPGDPYGVRSVKARFASPLTVRPVSDEFDEVAIDMVLETLPLVSALSLVLTPDGSVALSPDGSGVQSESLL